jgi:phospholipase/carboxylesterase
MLLVHGDQDPLIPAEAMFLAMNDLVEAKIPCQWHLSLGVGHGIDAGGLRHGGLFLAKAFGLRAR